MNLLSNLRNFLVSGLLIAVVAPCQTNIFGTERNDHLFPRSSGDNYYGEGGHDWIEGGGGCDDIYGDAGDDYLDGGEDSDYLDGGEGDDFIWDTSGDNSIHADFEGADIIYCISPDPFAWPDVVHCDVDDKVYCDDNDLIEVWDIVEGHYVMVFQGTGKEYYEWLDQ